MSYFNIHTHRKPQLTTEVCIRNGYLYPIKDLPDNYFLSKGLHPWFVTYYTEEMVKNQLQKILSEPKVLALGEIGLDKLKPHFEQQKRFFDLQINLAKDFQKPVVIHNVKSSEELRQYLLNSNIDVVLHGFNGGIELWNQLNVQGKTHVSIGQNIVRASKQLKGLIQQIPIEFLFAETDQSIVTIESIYQEIATIRAISLEDLKDKLALNFKRVFLKD